VFGFSVQAPRWLTGTGLRYFRTPPRGTALAIPYENNQRRSMMSGSTLNPPDEGGVEIGKGHGTGALGPSDSSDSGSDVQGEKRYPGDIEDELDAHALGQSAAELASDTDRYGTGEAASADGDNNLKADADILPDDVEDETRDIGDETADPADDENL
jgi:hypothetical protein